MQRLKRDMMERYEIPAHRPADTAAVQFGLGEALLGTVDRLLDDASLGVACVAAGEREAAKRLAAQDGMYTLLVRGYEGETPVRREQVIQCFTGVIDPEADFDGLMALAKRPGLRLALLDTDDEGAELALTLAARLLAERWRAGLGGLSFLCLGDDEGCARRARAFLRAVAAPWGLGAEFERWLADANDFRAALAESLAFRAEAGEAAKLRADMNYADDLIHVAEPFVRLTVEGGPIEGLAGKGVMYAEDIAPAFLAKHRVFDGVLCALAAPGWLLGCDTLSDCMKHERLRAFAGGAAYRELLPTLPMDREQAAAAMIETFGRLENPLNANHILRVCRPLLRRVETGLLPAVRAWAEERFDAPEGLSFALAATVMLYAGARRGKDSGGYEVARGEHTEPLWDDADRLAVFATLSHDMPPEALAYAALADRELWNGADLRRIDGLEERVALALAAMQRDPSWLPEVAGDA